MRVPTSLLPDHHEMTLHEGMSLTEFEGLLLDFLRSHLGPHDFSDLMFRMKLFADFNDDEKVCFKPTLIMQEEVEHAPKLCISICGKGVIETGHFLLGILLHLSLTSLCLLLCVFFLKFDLQF